MVALVNSHTNATSIGWHLWEIDLRFSPGLSPGWFSKRENVMQVSDALDTFGDSRGDCTTDCVDSHCNNLKVTSKLNFHKNLPGSLCSYLKESVSKPVLLKSTPTKIRQRMYQ